MLLTFVLVYQERPQKVLFSMMDMRTNHSSFLVHNGCSDLVIFIIYILRLFIYFENSRTIREKEERRRKKQPSILERLRRGKNITKMVNTRLNAIKSSYAQTKLESTRANWRSLEM